jgi:hypothetical protein
MSDPKKSGQVDEMGGAGAPGTGVGNISGMQLPLGVKKRKWALDHVVKESGDLTEGHMLVFLRGLDEGRIAEVCEALDLMQYDHVANMAREAVVREAVRSKIQEVVRKKGGGGGYVLYAPNKGKKGAPKPSGEFPTKLAAKRAELARFPPRDPKKLARLRKEITRMMKNPKKRAEAEHKAKQHEGASRELVERAILSGAVVKSLNEGLFREERSGSEWDDYIAKISDKAIQGDRGFQRIQGRLAKSTEMALAQAVKIVQRNLGGEARVKASKSPGSTEGGKPYIPFHVQIEAASVGPIYLYVDKGLPAIEMSDEAKNSLTKVTPGAAKAIRAALASAQDSLEQMDVVQSAVAERDAYLEKLEAGVDKMVAGMTPMQISLLKKILVAKYRGTK